MPGAPSQAGAAVAVGEFISRRELLPILRLDDRTFGRYLREGRLPAPDITFSPRNQLWRRERIERWLAEQTTAAGGAHAQVS